MTHIEVETIQGHILLPVATTKFQFDGGRVFASVGSEWFALRISEQEIRRLVGINQENISNKAMKKIPARKTKSLLMD